MERILKLFNRGKMEEIGNDRYLSHLILWPIKI